MVIENGVLGMLLDVVATPFADEHLSLPLMFMLSLVVTCLITTSTCMDLGAPKKGSNLQ